MKDTTANHKRLTAALDAEAMLPAADTEGHIAYREQAVERILAALSTATAVTPEPER